MPATEELMACAVSPATSLLTGSHEQLAVPFPGPYLSHMLSRSGFCSICLLVSLCFGRAAVAGSQGGPTLTDSVVSTLDPAPVEARLFYKGLPYGSEAQLGPLDVILNRGFALAQTDRHHRRIFEYEYGFAHVRNALAHPGRAIKRAGGWWQFLRKEILPLSYKPDDVKWYTNYTGHIIEGGIHTRRLQEWYKSRGVPIPGLMAGMTNLAAAYLNELYEHPRGKQGNAGTVADLYFFDLAGIALFSINPVARFFAEQLGLTVWTGQASISVPAGQIENNANYLVFKIPWGVLPKTSVFYWSGIGAQLGVTLHRADGLDVSIGLGKDAKRMATDPRTGDETADLSTFAAGLFVDRNGSLLASIHLSEVEHRLMKINVYPGVLHENFGAWAVVSHDLEVRIGLSNRHWLGAGLGLGW